MEPVSSLTTTTTASASSLMPMAARWRVPSSVDKDRSDVSGQQTAGSHDAVLADDDGPVMERGIGDEYISQQFPRHQAVDGNARVDIIVEADFAFKDDERPCMGLR